MQCCYWQIKFKVFKQFKQVLDDSKSLPAVTTVDEVPTAQLCSTVSTNSLSPATTTTCSSNDSSTNTTTGEPRPSIIPFTTNEHQSSQETSPPPSQDTSEITPLPSIHPTPHVSEKKLSTASAAPLLQHVLPTHQPLADIKDLETALSTTLGIHRSVSVAPTFHPFPHVATTPDALSSLVDQHNSLTAATVAAIMHKRVDATHHDDAMVESASIDPHNHHSLYTSNDPPRFSIESSRPASAQSPLVAEEIHTCENCEAPLMDARVFCSLDCAQSFSMMQVCGVHNCCLVSNCFFSFVCNAI